MKRDVEIVCPDLSEVLRLSKSLPRTRRNRRVLVALLSGLVLESAVYRENAVHGDRYVTAEVTTSGLVLTVTATGRLQPRKQLEIGTEISGTVESVHVSVNDHVNKGQLLAVIDTTRLKAQLLQVTAAQALAQARLAQSTASLESAESHQARILKARALSNNRLPSAQDVDEAAAQVARAEAGVAAAHAAVAQQHALVQSVRADLRKAQIRSPIDGVVLVRSAEPGQTVAASLQAPILLVLAQDLQQMELHVAVDEADIAAVSVGQPVSFSVDAFPDRTFGARISRIHIASSNTHGAGTQSGLVAGSPTSSEGTVVTYETVLTVDNSDLTLRPGMTATAEIVTSTLQGLTLVSNAAMRFTPEEAHVPGENDDRERGRGVMALMPYVAERWKCPREADESLGCVWVLEDDEPQLAVFKPGAGDGSMTQVLPLDQLPRWASLARLRNDQVLLRAIKRKLQPGTRVIVEDSTS